MTGSHSRLGISDRESRTTGVIRAYDTGTNYYLTTLLLQVVLTELSYIVPQVSSRQVCSMQAFCLVEL